MKRIFFLLITGIATCYSYAQIVVNPDGTHSVVTGNVVVNSDGTHSIITGNIVVNSDGSHSVVTGNTIVNSDGTHSVVTGNTIVNSNGSHTVIAGDVNDKTVINANRRLTAGRSDRVVLTNPDSENGNEYRFSDYNREKRLERRAIQIAEKQQLREMRRDFRRQKRRD